MGGFIGIWLGVSLIALFDFLESLTAFGVFLFDRMKHSRQVSELKSAIGSRIRSNSTFSSDSMPWAKSPQNQNNLRVHPVRRIVRTPWQNIVPFYFISFYFVLNKVILFHSAFIIVLKGTTFLVLFTSFHKKHVKLCIYYACYNDSMNIQFLNLKILKKATKETSLRIVSNNIKIYIL